MKHAISYFCVIITLGCFSPAYAQDSMAVSKIRYAEHPWALEFGISSYLSLQSFQGSALSVSRYISRNEKIRLGISPTFTSETRSSKYTPPDTLSSSYSTTYSNGSVSGSVQYLFYESPEENVSLFLGVGPTTNISWTRNSDETPRNTYSIGILGSCGVEWFASNRFSLHAEYGMGVRYTWNKYVDTSHTSEYKIWEITTRSVLFGLSVSF